MDFSVFHVPVLEWAIKDVERKYVKTVFFCLVFWYNQHRRMFVPLCLLQGCHLTDMIAAHAYCSVTIDTQTCAAYRSKDRNKEIKIEKR